MALLGEVGTRGRSGGDPVGRTTAEIEASIAATRKQLAATLDEIAVRVHPSTVAAQAKAKAAAAVDRTAGRAYVAANRGMEQVRAQFVDAKGNPRMERIVPVAAVAAVAVVAVVALRRRK
ncbi:DUF3618 domain-containing protein [Peterkaempfera bronchialis]|uniref:DUF3618 domain-containing protein n=1 Tax=Peterkaempfera bronchialis TaxID=2126346 RepID=UPI001E4EF00F|nr:DUF3618 domain-containing protein [Peterkaempfera bronchialis]